MSRLFLVRHGEATGDAADSGLSPLGVVQSRWLGERLRGGGVVEVRHGPRRRAVQTAAILGELCHVPVVADPVLDDRTPVPAPGQEASYPDRVQAWFAAVPDDERDEGGERLSAAVRTCLADDRPPHMPQVVCPSAVVGVVAGEFVRAPAGPDFSAMAGTIAQ